MAGELGPSDRWEESGPVNDMTEWGPGSLQSGEVPGRSSLGTRERVRPHYQGQEVLQQPRPVLLQVKGRAVGQRHNGSCGRRVGVSAPPPETDMETGAGGEPGWSGHPSKQGPGRDTHHRGRSIAPRAGERRGRQPRDSGCPGAGAGPRRSTAAPGGGKRGQRGEDEGQTAARPAPGEASGPETAGR